jgi:hypothetical protein
MPVFPVAWDKQVKPMNNITLEVLTSITTLSYSNLVWTIMPSFMDGYHPKKSILVSLTLSSEVSYNSLLSVLNDRKQQKFL